MAYGSKYYLDFYDRFSNLIKVYILQEDYTGAVIDITGGPDPLKIHWIGEGDDKYAVVKGSDCEVSVVSTTDQQFLDIFTNNARRYMVQVYNGATRMWQGMVDADSYKEPFTCEPYISVIHASDGLGELKNIKFPTPDSSVYHDLELSLIYYIKECLLQTGHSLDIYVANNISYTGATRVMEDVKVLHKSFRDDDNEWMSCYDVLEKILTSFGCRIYQWDGRWYIERIDYKKADTIDYYHYAYTGVYMTTVSGVDQRLTMTGKSGSPLCVFVDNSQFMEIVPAWKNANLSYEPGENKNMLRSTNRTGEFIDEEFQHPTSGAGPLEARYWTKQNPADPTTYGPFSCTKYPNTQYWQFRGVGYGHQTFTNLWGFQYSDAVTLDHQALTTNGTMQFKVEFKAQIDSDNTQLFYYKPFLRWNLKLVFADSAWAGSTPEGYIYSSPGNTLTLYMYETEDGKIKVTTAADWVYTISSPASTHPYPVPGVNSFRFKSLQEDHNFSIITEPISFAKGYSCQPTVQLRIYPLFGVYYLDDPLIPTYPAFTGYSYTMDLYEARVTLVNDELGYAGSAVVDINDNNRRTGDQTYWFTSGTSEYNEKYFNQFILLNTSGDEIETTWTVDGVVQGGLVNQIMVRELTAQFGSPMRKITGEFLSDDIDMGSVLIDPYGKKYICNGVEWRARFSQWNGEWMQLHDPDTIDAGDYDADDFNSGDFWAI